MFFHLLLIMYNKKMNYCLLICILLIFQIIPINYETLQITENRNMIKAGLNYTESFARYINGAENIGIGDGTFYNPYRFQENNAPKFINIIHNESLNLYYALFLDNCLDDSYKLLDFQISRDSYHSDENQTAFLILKDCKNVNVTFEFVNELTIPNDPDSTIQNDMYVYLLNCESIFIDSVKLEQYIKIEEAIRIENSSNIFINDIQVYNCDNAITVINSEEINVTNSEFIIFNTIQSNYYGFNITDSMYVIFDNVSYHIDKTISENISLEDLYFYCFNSTNIIFKNSYSEHAKHFDVYKSSNITISNNDFQTERIQMNIIECYIGLITCNKLSSSISTNILHLYYSEHFSIVKNDFYQGNYLICFELVTISSISHNLLIGGYCGVYLNSSNTNSIFYNVFGNKIFDNLKTNNINIYFDSTNYINIYNNTFYEPMSDYFKFNNLNPHGSNLIYFSHNYYQNYTGGLCIIECEEYNFRTYDNFVLNMSTDEYYFVNLTNGVQMYYNQVYTTSIDFLLITGYYSGYVEFLVNDEIVYTTQVERFMYIKYKYRNIPTEFINTFNCTYRFIYDNNIVSKTQMFEIFNDIPNIEIKTHSGNTIEIIIDDYAHQLLSINITINNKLIEEIKLDRYEYIYNYYYTNYILRDFKIDIDIIETVNDTMIVVYNNSSLIHLEYPTYVIVIIVLLSIGGVALIGVIIYKYYISKKPKHQTLKDLMKKNELV